MGSGMRVEVDVTLSSLRGEKVTTPLRVIKLEGRTGFWQEIQVLIHVCSAGHLS